MWLVVSTRRSSLIPRCIYKYNLPVTCTPPPPSSYRSLTSAPPKLSSEPVKHISFHTPTHTHIHTPLTTSRPIPLKSVSVSIQSNTSINAHPDTPTYSDNFILMDPPTSNLPREIYPSHSPSHTYIKSKQGLLRMEDVSGILHAGRYETVQLLQLLDRVDPGQILHLLRLFLREGILLSSAIIDKAMRISALTGSKSWMQIALLSARMCAKYPSLTGLIFMARHDRLCITALFVSLESLKGEGIKIPFHFYNAALATLIDVGDVKIALEFAFFMKANGKVVPQKVTAQLVEQVMINQPGLIRQLEEGEWMDAKTCVKSIDSLLTASHFNAMVTLVRFMDTKGFKAPDHAVEKAIIHFASKASVPETQSLLLHIIHHHATSPLHSSTIRLVFDILIDAKQFEQLPLVLPALEGKGATITYDMYMILLDHYHGPLAQTLVERMIKKGVKVDGNVLLLLARAHIQSKNIAAALPVIHSMKSLGVTMTTVDLVKGLEAIESSDVAAGHVTEILQLDVTGTAGPIKYDPQVRAAAITAYGRCGLIHHVDRLLDEIEMKMAHNHLGHNCSYDCYAALMDVYTKARLPNQMQRIYKIIGCVEGKIKGDYHSLAAKSFALVKDLPNMEIATNRALDTLIKEPQLKCKVDAYWSSTVISCYIENNKINEAMKMICYLEEIGLINALDYQSLALGLAKKGKRKEVEGVLRQMGERGMELGEDGYRALITSYKHNTQPIPIQDILVAMQRDGVTPTLSIYNAFIDTLGIQGDLYKVNRMVLALKGDGFTPTSATHLSIINTCVTARGWETLYQLFNEISSKGMIEPSVIKAFYDAFIFQGDLTHVNSVIQKIEADISTYPDDSTILPFLISLYERDGKINKIMSILQRVRDTHPCVHQVGYEKAIEVLTSRHYDTDALTAYNHMEKEWGPDSGTPTIYHNILCSAIRVGDVKRAKSTLRIIEQEQEKGMSDIAPITMIEAYLLVSEYTKALEWLKFGRNQQQLFKTIIYDNISQGLLSQSKHTSSLRVLNWMIEDQVFPSDITGDVMVGVAAMCDNIIAMDQGLEKLRARGVLWLTPHTYRAVQAAYVSKGCFERLPVLLEYWIPRNLNPIEAGLGVATILAKQGNVTVVSRVIEWIRKKEGDCLSLNPVLYVDFLTTEAIVDNYTIFCSALTALGLSGSKETLMRKERNGEGIMKELEGRDKRAYESTESTTNQSLSDFKTCPNNNEINGVTLVKGKRNEAEQTNKLKENFNLGTLLARGLGVAKAQPTHSLLNTLLSIGYEYTALDLLLALSTNTMSVLNETRDLSPITQLHLFNLTAQNNQWDKAIKLVNLVTTNELDNLQDITTATSLPLTNVHQHHIPIDNFLVRCVSHCPSDLISPLLHHVLRLGQLKHSTSLTTTINLLIQKHDWTTILSIFQSVSPRPTTNDFNTLFDNCMHNGALSIVCDGFRCMGQRHISQDASSYGYMLWALRGIGDKDGIQQALLMSRSAADLINQVGFTFFIENALLSCHSVGLYSEAIGIYNETVRKGTVPLKDTIIVPIFDALSRSNQVDSMWTLCKKVNTLPSLTDPVLSIFIEGLMQSKQYSRVWMVLNKCHKTTGIGVFQTAMIGFQLASLPEDVLKVYDLIAKRGIPSTRNLTMILLETACNSGHVLGILKSLKALQGHGEPIEDDIWSTAIQGLARSGNVMMAYRMSESVLDTNRIPDCCAIWSIISGLVKMNKGHIIVMYLKKICKAGGRVERRVYEHLLNNHQHRISKNEINEIRKFAVEAGYHDIS